MPFGSDRTVAVNLRMNVTDFVGKAAVAQRKMADLGKAGLDSATKSKAAWEHVGTGALVAGAAVAAGAGLAVKAYADFDRELSNVRAVSGATAGEMDRLREAALQAGADTKFSASQAAQAQAELAKVGISTADILGGALRGSLDLAAAGNLDLARAATIAGQAMKIFDLAGRDVGRIADVLAAGANKSAADVDTLAQALQQGGLVAEQTGLTLEDTVGTLSAFADNALMGSDAGTSLKTMLQRLNPQSKQAAAAMDELNLRAYDQQGRFVGITEYAQKLQDGLRDLSTEQRNSALQTVFGADAIRAATILYDLGERGVRGYITAVNDQGAAQRFASVQMNNLSGDVEQLRGSIETALIQAGSAGNDVLRTLTQTATGAVNAFGQLPGPVQAGGLALAGVAAAALLAGGAFLSVVPRIAATRAALAELGVTAATTRTRLATAATFLTGPWGVALAAGTVVLGGLVKMQLDAAERTREFRDALDQQTGALTQQNRQIVATDLQSRGWLKRVADLKINTELLTDAVLGDAEAMANLEWEQRRSEAAARAYIAAQEDQSAAQLRVTQGITVAGDEQNNLAVADYRRAETLRTLLPELARVRDGYGQESQAQREVATAARDAASAEDTHAASARVSAEATRDVAAASEEAEREIRDYLRAQIDAGLAVLSTRAAQRELIEATNAARDAAKENGRTLSLSSEEGLKNQAALDAQARSANNLAQAVYDETGSEEKMRDSMKKSRDELIKTYLQFDSNEQRAKAYADQVLQIPSAKATTITQPGMTGALEMTAELKRRIDALKDKTIRVTTIETRNRAGVGGTRDPFYGAAGSATGGPVRGPGTGTSDSVPAWLSTGEYVVRAAAVDKYGQAFFDKVNAMRFAAGGVVPRVPAAPRPSGASAAVHGWTGPLVQATIIAADEQAAARELELRFSSAFTGYGLAGVAAGAGVG